MPRLVGRPGRRRAAAKGRERPHWQLGLRLRVKVSLKLKPKPTLHCRVNAAVTVLAKVAGEAAAPGHSGWEFGALRVGLGLAGRVDIGAQRGVEVGTVTSPVSLAGRVAGRLGLGATVA